MLNNILNEKNIKMNIWKEINNEILETMNEINGIVLLMHNSIEFTELIDLLNITKSDSYSDVLYISLIRSYQYMKNVLDLKPLKNKKITFIDCVSGYSFPIDENIDQAFYHKPPEKLEQLEEIINYGMKKTNPDIVIIDSISHFINFTQSSEYQINNLYNSLNTIKNQQINQDKKTTFIMIYDNKTNKIKNLPKNLTDSIIKIEKTDFSIEKKPGIFI